MTAYQLLAKGRRTFTQDALARDFMGDSVGPNSPSAVSWDCLGAIFKAYERIDSQERHRIAKQAFDLCRARYGHARLGRLHYDEALSLLKDAGV